ncbi:secretion system apparatus protein SsaU [Caballeronia mineralivorans PML1(12)]|uniref:Secretion system apparatus protein SsaU n=1 Tax=Caballeronia mineralivorans PML1(12) TaxID=908627 RepID=A0A0J1CLY2_9BURK|nr:EscU/YscU/HrcU family type III secretion system export apparatus switch protein [Caballeronia mineralivorans]KLU21519.1 secretion system apparatus protein SsaU [Caballeronia mineralivorans PML1(12)]
MSEKTEQPTAKRREDGRKKGQVAKSADVTTCVQLAVLLVYFLFQGTALWQAMEGLISATTAVINFPLREALSRLVNVFGAVMLRFILPLGVLLIVATLASILLQIGLVFAPESVMPKGEKLSPISNAKQIFSIKSLVEFCKSLIKVGALSIVFYYLLREHISSLQFLPLCGIECGISVTAQLIGWTWWSLIVVYIVLGGADYVFQRRRLTKELMMSREEVEREYKDAEGDPEIKGKRKEVNREAQNSNMAVNVKKSSVIVRNPTHIAVCLYYRAGETPLPKVIEMGVDARARRIVELAEAAGIPVVEHVYVARSLHASVDVGSYIPSTLIEPVAEILRFVTDLREDEE